MDENVAVFRDAEGLEKALETVKRLKEEAESCYIDDRGSVFNQDVLGAIELGFMLDNAEATCVGRDPPHREPRRPVPHRLPRAQRRGVAQAHRPVARTATAPEISYSDVTMTQWEPQERTY